MTRQVGALYSDYMRGVLGWKKKNHPPVPSHRLAKHHKLTAEERQVAEYAAERARAYRRFYEGDTTVDARFTGETAEELVGRMLPDIGPRRQYHILTVACRIATERGVDMSCRSRKEYGSGTAA